MKQPLTGKKRDARALVIVLGSMTLAFIVGIQTAGEVQPIVGATKAGGTVVQGDLNRNGIIDENDAQLALQIARAERTPLPQELAADPNEDYAITMDDVRLIRAALEKMQHLSSAASSTDR